MDFLLFIKAFLNLGPFLNVKGVPMLPKHLLLREPLINSARFDVCSEMILTANTDFKRRPGPPSLSEPGPGSQWKSVLNPSILKNCPFQFLNHGLFDVVFTEKVFNSGAIP